MNNVSLIGRLVRDPELRYTTSQTAVGTFTIAVDRQKKKIMDRLQILSVFQRLGKLRKIVPDI